MTLLLIYPPFAMPDKPYISLPVLAAHLNAQNIPVSCWDANLAFFRKALSPEVLNTQHPYGEKKVENLFQDNTLGNRERLDLLGQYLNQISSPREKLSLADNTGYIRYDADTSFFDSRSLLQATQWPDSLIRKRFYSEVHRIVDDQDPVIAGISVPFPDQILPALTLATIFKEIQPDLPIILGGAFITIHMRAPENQELFDFIDALVLGDGEVNLPLLYDHVVKNGSLSEVPNLNGLVSRNRLGEKSEVTPVIHPMRGAEVPAYSHLPLDDYLIPRNKGAVLFRLSRGCYWGRCAFCNCLSPIIKAYDRAGFEETYQSLINTLEVTGAPVVHFTDDAADPEMLAYLAERLIAEKRQVQWTVNTRVDRKFTLSLLSTMRQAGCFSLFLGVESCCDRVLQKMNKGTTLKQIERQLTDLSWAGMSANIYMITGFPTETENEARSSFDKVCEWLDQNLVRQVVYNLFSLTPSSPVAANPKNFGITAIPDSKGKDLFPPFSDFDCSTGMLRKQARELCFSFTQILAQKKELKNYDQT